MSPSGQVRVIGVSQWGVGESDEVDYLIIVANAFSLFPLAKLTYKEMVASQWASMFLFFN